MHVDLWSPGATEDDNSNQGYLVNIMSDLIQFTISSPTTSIDATSLAQLYIFEVFLYLSIFSVVEIDDGYIVFWMKHK